MPKHSAVHLLQPFRRRVLPGLLRRLLHWKGLNPIEHIDLVEDLEQELYLDCLQHADTVLALDRRARHTRWLRLLERCIYRHHVRSQRLHALEAEIDLVSGEGSCPTQATTDPVATYGHDLAARHRRFLHRLQDEASYLKNGRLNCRQSAESLGIHVGSLKHSWGDIAADLGLDSEFFCFWRRRLVEALVGLAADLLRDTEQVAVHDEPLRRRPDPRGRLRRIRKLRGYLGHGPIPADVRNVIAHYRRGQTMRTPRQILADAVLLRPHDDAVQLWCFEAALADGDHRAASQAIRAARRTEAEPVRVLLARVRLLQERGRTLAAFRLLDRHPRRDPRILAALGSLVG